MTKAVKANALEKGASIGILGAGQLGRMLAQAANEIGYQTHIFAPNAQLSTTPAGQVADAITQGAYDDETQLMAFAEQVDIITYEFENVPQQTISFLQQYKPIFPDRQALEISQDRWVEKKFIQKLGIPVTAFCDIAEWEHLNESWLAFEQDGILKTRRFGYDGKGQWRIKSTQDMHTAFEELAGRPAILEKAILFDKEISIIAARNQNGQLAIYDIVENTHHNHILKYSRLPANIPATIEQTARETAEKLLIALQYVGVLAIEFFICGNMLLVNEIAPRVHNSGHWTMDACAVSQFKQHILAITGHTLDNPTRICDVVMTNLIGKDIIDVREKPRAENEYFHDYGKTTIREDRKMGHINKLYPLPKNT